MAIQHHFPVESILSRAFAYADATPPAISGQQGHNQCFGLACSLINGFGLSESDALAVLQKYNQRCQPCWSDRELSHKIRSAAPARHSKPRGHLRGHDPPPRLATPFRPEPRQVEDPVKAVEKYLADFRISEVDLWECSPVRPPDDWREDGQCLVLAFYEPDEQVNIVVNHSDGRPRGEGLTLSRDAMVRRLGSFAGSSAGGWLRMNPVADGIADENVTAFRFALLECDHVAPNLQLSLFARLPVPIAAILSSGGKSVHAWVRVDCATLDDYRETARRLLDLLKRFGADDKNKNPSRLSRLPGITRKLGAQGDGSQRLLYLNPTPTNQPIF